VIRGELARDGVVLARQTVQQQSTCALGHLSDHGTPTISCLVLLDVAPQLVEAVKLLKAGIYRK
jgi:hypothetical protein